MIRRLLAAVVFVLALLSLGAEIVSYVPNDRLWQGVGWGATVYWTESIWSPQSYGLDRPKFSLALHVSSGQLSVKHCVRVENGLARSVNLFEYRIPYITHLFRNRIVAIPPAPIMMSGACYTPLWRLDVHLWWIAAASWTYCVVVFIRGPYRRYRRRRKGLCLKCGYNLTANVSGVCPECGERI